MSEVLIAGGGIAGLVTALTLHQIGVRCTVFETFPDATPRGVGMNLQPNAVRELYELGIGGAALNSVGIPLREWALVSLNGRDIYSEGRGMDAGFHWPQFSVDRGLLHALLHRTAQRRLGHHCLVMDSPVTGYEQDADGVTLFLGNGRQARGALLIAADGLYSTIRAQMFPDEGPLNWGRAVLWRGVTRARPLRTGSSYVAMGMADRHFLFYPISHPGRDGKAMIHWVAVAQVDDHPSRASDRWLRKVPTRAILPFFESWRELWIDVHAMMAASAHAYETPLVDRPALRSWHRGRVVLLGDAAHPMYPTAATGASQAIIDARVLGASMIEAGVTPAALHAYDDMLCAPVSALVERNRVEGRFELLRIVHERCGGSFTDLDSVVPPREREDFMLRYTRATEFAAEMLNNAPPIIAPGARAAVA
ncbi:flavin-dependent oxidoreductase [Pararhodobacter marinus]|uniref:Flavin-dependent oxidoreductase n=3 Tax=Pararhodobacter marinus TaxID=2184063 RepID=A0A2U2CBB3_9RHOB|nr:FAD-dependent monooxygenase [Pararhodobacter marinus]PWE29152.1 flavin-dependent oxidoreductase [Pararhodobacter marinus]